MIEMENYHEYCQHRKKNMYAYKSSMFLNKNVRLTEQAIIATNITIRKFSFFELWDLDLWINQRRLQH